MNDKKTIDLRNCKMGDILISSQGSILEYIAPTPFKNITYLDHAVRYVKKANGDKYPDNCYGSRTHDGYVYAKKRIPETDHDIIEVHSVKNVSEEGIKEMEHYLDMNEEELTYMIGFLLENRNKNEEE